MKRKPTVGALRENVAEFHEAVEKGYQPKCSLGRYVCRSCKAGAGSEFDGLCSRCRGCNSTQAKQTLEKAT